VVADTRQGQGIGSALVLAGLVAGVLLSACFARHALRAATPLLDLRLFRNHAYSAAAATV